MEALLWVLAAAVVFLIAYATNHYTWEDGHKAGYRIGYLTAQRDILIDANRRLERFAEQYAKAVYGMDDDDNEEDSNSTDLGYVGVPLTGANG